MSEHTDHEKLVPDIMLAQAMAEAEKEYRENAAHHVAELATKSALPTTDEAVTKLVAETNETVVRRLITRANEASNLVYTRQISFSDLPRDGETMTPDGSPDEYFINLQTSFETMRESGRNNLEYNKRDTIDTKIAHRLLIEDPNPFLAALDAAGFGSQKETIVTDILSKVNRYRYPTHYGLSHTYESGQITELYDSLVKSVGRTLVASRITNELDPTHVPILQLEPEYAKAVLHNLYGTWSRYISVVASTQSRWSDQSISSPVSLFRPLDQLVTELQNTENEGLLTPDGIIRAFTRRGDFAGRIEMMRQHQRERQAMAAKRAEEARAYNKTVPPALKQALNKEIAEAQLSPEYDEFIHGEDIGDAYYVASWDQVNKILLAQAAVYATKVTNDPASNHNIWGRGFNTNYAAKIRPKGFHGKVGDAHLVRLPIEEVQEKYTTDDTVILGRLAVVADMYSTGRGKVGESLQDIVFQLRNPNDEQARRIDLVTHSVNGDKVAEYLGTESSSMAIIQKMRSIKNAYSGGLPGLGKR